MTTIPARCAGDPLDDKSSVSPSTPVESRRRQNLSMLFRSSTRRSKSVSSPATSPPTCEERIHYPVFNPQDPRHNPAAASSSWLRSGYNVSKTPSPQKPARWVQDLPGRSLRKARSGLLALTAGMRTHSTFRSKASRESFPEISPLYPLPEGFSVVPGGCVFPATVSEASTEEDPDFGVQIYRTCCNCERPFSSSSWGSDESCEVKLSSSLALIGPSALSKADLGPSRSTTNSSRKREDDTSSSQELYVDTSTSDVLERRQTIKWHDGYVKKPVPQVDSDSSATTGSTSRDTQQSDGFQISDDMVLEPFPQLELSSSDSSSGVAHFEQGSESASPVCLERTESLRGAPSTDQSPRRRSSESMDAIGNELSEELRQYVGAMERFTAHGTSGVSAPPSATTDSIADDSSDHAALGRQADKQASSAPRDRQEGSNSSSDGSGSTNPSGPTVGANASQSSDPTSPTETDPMSDKDEFFLVDGKSGDYPPSRGDNPVKTEKRIVSDGSIHSGPGLDRDPGNRNQFVPEAVGPGGPLPREMQRRDNRGVIERNSSDSSEEYIATYQMLRRRFRSWSDD
ncbi:hypothetical protein VTN00DRAFT_338 [Thermoascus crustaceus]|uniref:uncharacterized protein n=1 Tax=Thermoascus crustaceus TaxID=5088 RepID=UPI0037427899